MNKYQERLSNGILKENPTFILMLGLCPTLAVTTSAINGIGMGLTSTAVLVMSNAMISALRKAIPDKVRMPSYIVIVATLVTVVQFLLQGYVPSLYDALGIYIPLIVVNCIILGRAEAYASKNPVGLSVFDGLGMGLGFTLGLTLIGAFREVIGNGSIFNVGIMPESYEPITIFILAPGAFFVLAMLTALQNKLKLPSATNTTGESTANACGGNCGGCHDSTCVANHEVLSGIKKAEDTAKNVTSKMASKARICEEVKKSEETKKSEEVKKSEEAKRSEEVKKLEEAKRSEEGKNLQETVDQEKTTGKIR